MAEAIAGLVLGRLADAAVREIVFLCGVGDKLDSIQHELKWICAFLKDADSKRNSDERVKTWVSDVREVAYRIEDVIDTFVAEVDDHNRPGKVNTLKRILRKPKQLPIVHKLISEMDNIQKTLIQINELTERYGINKELGDNNNNGYVPERKPIVLSDDDDPDIVGFEKDTKNIIKKLVDPGIERRCVVSIVGQGGLGKSTLARKVYNSDKIKKDFKCRLWLSISQQYIMANLLMSMLEKIRPLNEYEKVLLQKNDQHSRQTIEEHFITQLKMSLSQNRYLIIIDDVWTDDLWIQIKVALPDVGNGSRVLVTTRFSDIARKADPLCDPYKLRYLSEEESQNLLLKKAFPYQDSKPYLHVLSDLPKKFAERCGGLPLALQVVGGLLSIHPPMYNSWHKVFENFSWHDDKGKKCTEILETSYEDLPFLLKPCFMYFGLFPEDHEIKAKSLIRMWVAEGFIPEEDKRTMEQTAEDYLEELIQRSMIQVSRRYCNGSVKYCRIHDLLHDLAIEKGRQNGFLEIIPSQGEGEGGSCSSKLTTVRRARAVINNRENNIEYPGPNIRSLFMSMVHGMLNTERLRFLKVLVASGQMDNFYVRNPVNTKHILKRSTQLKYIALKPTGSTKQLVGIEGLRHMKNLQTLDVPNFFFESRHPIWDIKTLRHVTLEGWFCWGPPSEAFLPNLQTLRTMRSCDEWLIKGWPRMPNIRVLKIEIKTANYGDSFDAFLRGLHHLTSLSVHIDNKLLYVCDHMRDMSVFPWYNHLQSLTVRGPWRAGAHRLVFPIHITKLSLRDSQFEEDLMPVLEKLPCLRKFVASDAYMGKQLNCSAGGFPHLQFLILGSLRNLEEWKAEEGAMPMLKEISLNFCPKLRLIPGLRHMTSLKKFTMIYSSELDGPRALRQSLLEDPSHKLRDGQYVQFVFYRV